MQPSTSGSGVQLYPQWVFCSRSHYGGSERISTRDYVSELYGHVILTRTFDRGFAAALVGVGAAGQAGVNMGYPREPLPAWRRVKVRIEDATAAAILELEAGAFADLQRRRAEQLAKIGRGEAEEAAVLVDGQRGTDRGRGGDWRGGLAGAGGEEQSGA
jgi:hypothetical protein